MSAISPYPAIPTIHSLSVTLRPVVRRLLPLAVIILLHLGFFYALLNGLLKKPTLLVPKEVLVHFITPEAKPAAQPMQPQPKPKPTPPKTLPVIKQPVPKPRPVAPPVNPAPSEQAITAPPSPPQSMPAQPAAAEPQPAVSAPAPAPAAPPPTISSGVEYLRPPQPEYPLLSRRKGEEGKVVLRALINLKGRPDQVEIQTSSGSTRLDEAARQAVQRAVFKPHLENGNPVMVYAIVPIKFQLDR